MKVYELEKRKFVIAALATIIVVVYIVRLFVLQIMSDDYKKNADSNAFFKKIEYPSRGVVTDRNGQLLVFNQPSYDIMVVMKEAKGRIDTADFCKTLGITKEFFIQRMNNIKDRSKNPGYSQYTQQLFMRQLSDKEFSVFNEKIFRYPGFYITRRSIRRYKYPYAAHVLGDVAEVSPADIEEDDYYIPGDYIGKLGIERSYETELRGEKGVKILLRDASGKIQGSYRNGEFDKKSIPGKNLTLSLDVRLQALGERLMEGKVGSIVAIEPSTGQVLCMVSSPTFDPRKMTGRNRWTVMKKLSQDPNTPMLNRSIMGQYPPGSTFKTSQALTFLQEGIVNQHTLYPCTHGFYYRGLHVGCHSHGAPLPVVPALSTSCNSYFCWGLYYMIGNRKKYKNVQQAMDTWRDYMVSMGFGYRLGIDLPGEKRGLIPNAKYYDKAYRGSWNGLTVISISIGQGEVNLTPLQIANLGATIANRGYYYTPHLVREIEGGEIDKKYSERHYTKAGREAYELVVQGMRSSALGGTCRMLGASNLEMCGKTGTAQNKGKDHSVFMGFAPMSSPKIAVAVYVENGGWGATYGVPIGGLIMEQYINGCLSESSEVKASEIQSRHLISVTPDQLFKNELGDDSVRVKKPLPADSLKVKKQTAKPKQ